MSETATRSWVWHSTPASRAEGKTSLLALLETTLCVTAYWALWKWLGVTWHHWLIVMATPLVLLRSDESVIKGARWFDGYSVELDRLGTARNVLFFLLRAALAFGAAWLLAKHWLHGTTTSALFFNAMLVGFFSWMTSSTLYGCVDNSRKSMDFSPPLTGMVTAIVLSAILNPPNGWATFSAMATSVAGAFFPWLAFLFFALAAKWHRIFFSLAGMTLVAIITPAAAAARLLRALLIRLLATARHSVDGVLALPSNWSLAVSSTDLLQPPELVPDSRRSTFGGALSFSRINPEGSQKDVFDYSIGVVGALIYFTPALLWRWSIKSTAWFYFPLAFVAKSGMAETDTVRASLTKANSTKLFNILCFLTAIINLTSAAIALVRPDWLALMVAKTTIAGAPIPPLGYLLVLDWSRIADQPWQLAYLPSAALSVLLFFMYDNIGRNIENGIPEARYYPQLRLMRRAANVSRVLTLSGLAIMLWYFTRAMWSWDQLKAGAFWWL